MDSHAKSIISTAVIIIFIVMAMGSYSGYSDSKGRQFDDELCRTLDQAITFEADIFTTVIDKETKEPIPGVEVTIKVHHYEAVSKYDKDLDRTICKKKLIWEDDITEFTDEHGIVTFRAGTFLFVHKLDMVMVTVEANLNDKGYYKKFQKRSHNNTSDMYFKIEALDTDLW